MSSNSMNSPRDAALNVVSIVVATDVGASDSLARCLAAIGQHHQRVDCEILVVAPESNKPVVAEDSAWLMDRCQTIPCAAAAPIEARYNLGISASQSDLILLIDAQVVVESDWLAPLVKAASKNPSAAALGGRLQDTQGHLKSAGLTFEPKAGFLPMFKGESKASFRVLQKHPVTAVDFGLTLITRAAVRAIGVLDEGLASFAGIDFCLRATAAGLMVDYVPQSLATDMRALTLGDGLQDADPIMLCAQVNGLDRFYQKWIAGGMMGADQSLLTAMSAYYALLKATCSERLRGIGVIDPEGLLGELDTPPYPGATT